MNDLNICITTRDGDVERSLCISNFAPSQRATIEAAPAHLSPKAATPALEWSNTLVNGERVNHAQAVALCEALGEGWRLPTITELLTLVDYTRCNPAINTDLYPDTKSGAYWTNSEHAADSSYAWIVLFSYGNSNDYHRDSNVAFVRAVRSVPAGQ